MSEAAKMLEKFGIPYEIEVTSAHRSPARTHVARIAVPMATTLVSGLASLLSIVQMPACVPVAAMAIDKPGAINAGIYAAEIIATFDPEIAKRLIAYKEELAKSVAEKSARVKQQYAGKAR
jgi:phosphoribosylaminoimidazole carboxylase PurE protein